MQTTCFIEEKGDFIVIIIKHNNLMQFQCGIDVKPIIIGFPFRFNRLLYTGHTPGTSPVKAAFISRFMFVWAT